MELALILVQVPELAQELKHPARTLRPLPKLEHKLVKQTVLLLAKIRSQTKGPQILTQRVLINKSIFAPDLGFRT